MLELRDLRPEAATDLTRRGLLQDEVPQMGYRSLPHRSDSVRLMKELVAQFGEDALRLCPGFTDKNGRLGFRVADAARDGYVVPYLDEAGRITGFQVRFLGGSYWTPLGTQLSQVYHLAGCPDPGGDLYVTERGTKANVAHMHGGIAVFAVAGQSLASEHVEVIARLRPGRVIVALDEEENVNTDRARERWLRALADAGLPVYRARWEGDDFGGPKGLDDLLASGGRPRVRAVHFVPVAMGESRRPRPAADRAQSPPAPLSRKCARRPIRRSMPSSGTR